MTNKALSRAASEAFFILMLACLLLITFIAGMATQDIRGKIIVKPACVTLAPDNDERYEPDGEIIITRK